MFCSTYYVFIFIVCTNMPKQIPGRRKLTDSDKLNFWFWYKGESVFWGAVRKREKETVREKEKEQSGRRPQTAMLYEQGLGMPACIWLQWLVCGLG